MMQESMAEFPHGERMQNFGRTVAPVRLPKIKEIAGVEVDESYGSYTIWGTPNSADFGFARIGDRGYIDVRRNPHNVFQFHPEEWPNIEEYLDDCPFIDDFGHGVLKILSEKNWDKHYKSRYKKYHKGEY